MHAEELGIKAKHLGEKVKKVFEMATEWNAVVLLDGRHAPGNRSCSVIDIISEADVFMAERSYADIARNDLSPVSDITHILWLLWLCHILKHRSLSMRARILQGHHLPDHQSFLNN